jgi:hypothetical protein
LRNSSVFTAICVLPYAKFGTFELWAFFGRRKLNDLKGIIKLLLVTRAGRALPELPDPINHASRYRCAE